MPTAIRRSRRRIPLSAPGIGGWTHPDPTVGSIPIDPAVPISPLRRPGRLRIALLTLAVLCLGLRGSLLGDTGTGPKETWWSLRPVTRPEVPGDPSARPNPIDRFLDAARSARGVHPLGPADRLTLLRRVHLDLVGIPPTPEEQEAFLADESPDAYESVVDRLLAGEQHAVRYARHWLDVLRYADADERMTAAPGIHLWRDWVIQSLHDDLPFDQFVQVQLTGRRSNERTQMSATGYRSAREPRPGDLFALGFLARGTGEDPQDLAINAVDTVSGAFLGMTVSCAKCHDHVFDPVSQVDYYSMKALFDPLVLRKVTLAPATDLLAAGRAQAERERQRGPLERERATLLEPFRRQLHDDRVAMLPPDVQAVIRKPEKERTPAEQRIADDYFPILRIDGDKIDAVLPDEVRRKSRELQGRIEAIDNEFRRGNTPAIPVFHTVEIDRVREREKSHVLTSGDPTRPEKDREVVPGWPFAREAPDLREGRVEAFADWLTAPDNPLFARVAVNRLWQWHFGEGLHRHPSDFGRQTGTPPHPELLDWLASEFIAGGFSQKRLHRLIVTSAAYRMASATGPDADANHRLDPGNTTLWRHPVRRLEAEPIWDAIHFAAGRLDLRVGGPSFDPARDRDRPRRGGSDAPPDGPAMRRRGVYMVRGFSTSREVTPGFLRTFDVDDGREPCPVRTRTVTAPQALFLMNSPEVDEAAGHFAARLRSESGGDLGRAVDLAHRLTLGRPARDGEKERALAYLEGDPARLDRFAWLLFNLDEFLHVP